MSNITVNNPQSSRRVEPSVVEGSRYRNEIKQFGLAGDRVEKRLELSHRGFKDFSAIIAANRFNWYSLQERDRLDQVAFDYLGDSRLWWVVADLNSDILKDTLELPVGTLIRLPNLDVLEELGL